MYNFGQIEWMLLHKMPEPAKFFWRIYKIFGVWVVSCLVSFSAGGEGTDYSEAKDTWWRQEINTSVHTQLCLKHCNLLPQSINPLLILGYLAWIKIKSQNPRIPKAGKALSAHGAQTVPNPHLVPTPELWVTCPALPWAPPGIGTPNLVDIWRFLSLEKVWALWAVRHCHIFSLPPFTLWNLLF